MDCNQTSCSDCQYCETVFKEAAVVNDEEVKRAAGKVRDFSEKLVSGEIFEVPHSHLIFRIPFLKTLLKHLLKWRLKKERNLD